SLTYLGGEKTSPGRSCWDFSGLEGWALPGGWVAWASGCALGAGVLGSARTSRTVGGTTSIAGMSGTAGDGVELVLGVAAGEGVELPGGGIERLSEPPGGSVTLVGEYVYSSL